MATGRVTPRRGEDGRRTRLQVGPPPRASSYSSYPAEIPASVVGIAADSDLGGRQGGDHE